MEKRSGCREIWVLFVSVVIITNTTAKLEAKLIVIVSFIRHGLV